MALSARLGEAGLKPASIETTATASLEKGEKGYSVTSVHLDVVADVPNIDPASFEAAADATRTGCIVSRLLRADITMTARLTSASRA
jgi:osmotically inducible protein OsmC